MGRTAKPEHVIVEQVCRFPEVDRAILFGSRARGDAGPRSDVDLALSCPSASRARWLEISEAVQDAETLLFIDVVRLEDAPASLRREIVRSGKVIFERRKD